MKNLLNTYDEFINLIGKCFGDTVEVVNKEIIDINAGVKGICVDRVKKFFSSPIMILGTQIPKKEVLEEMMREGDEDILICSGKDNNIFFIKMNEISAIGKSIILIKRELNLEDIQITDKQKSDVQREIDKLDKRLHEKIIGMNPSDISKILKDTI